MHTSALKKTKEVVIEKVADPAVVVSGLVVGFGSGVVVDGLLGLKLLLHSSDSQ